MSREAFFTSLVAYLKELIHLTPCSDCVYLIWLCIKTGILNIDDSELIA